MTNLRRFALILAAGAALAGTPAMGQAGSGFAPAAFVNDQVVTAYDVDQRRRLLTLAAGREVSAEDAMTAMIDSRLKRRAAEQAGVEADREGVENGLARFAQSLGLDAAGLQARMKQAGVSRVALRDYVETEVMWSGFVRRTFLSRAQVTDAQLEDELANSDRLVNRAYDLSEIAIPYGADREAALAAAADASRQINAGADSAPLARRLSRAPTRQNGGRVGLVPAARLPGPLREALERLSPGQATPPLEMAQGVVVLALHDVQEQRAELTPELREQVRARMLEERLTRLADGRLNELRAEAFVEKGR
ncbi:peptidylprolyl isomerase [Rhodovulum sp. DZ06]|uniref:peptidylprolyl isomerase n=1 Tax=Rhodovulum sp. DZ06 TaxID=3425126 RepID=UPI003D33B665